jgi:hypothetical protein
MNSSIPSTSTTNNTTTRSSRRRSHQDSIASSITQTTNNTSPPKTSSSITPNSKLTIPVSDSDRRYVTNQISQLNTKSLQLLYELIYSISPSTLSIIIPTTTTSTHPTTTTTATTIITTSSSNNSSNNNNTIQPQPTTPPISFSIDIKNTSTIVFRQIEEFTREAVGDDIEITQPITKKSKQIIPLKTNGPRIARLENEDVHTTFHSTIPVTLLSKQNPTKHPWVCNFPGCNEQFTLKLGIINHTHKHLDGGIVSLDRNKRSTRDQIIDIFGVPVILLAKDKGEFPWICKFENCPRTEGFRSLDKIENHISAHLNPKFMCRVCERQVFTIQALEVHMLRTHPVVS